MDGPLHKRRHCVTQIISGQAWGSPSHHLKCRQLGPGRCVGTEARASCCDQSARINRGAHARPTRGSPAWLFPRGWWGNSERRKWNRCRCLRRKAGGQRSPPLSTGPPGTGWCCPPPRTSRDWESPSPSGTTVDQTETKQYRVGVVFFRPPETSGRAHNSLRRPSWFSCQNGAAVQTTLVFVSADSTTPTSLTHLNDLNVLFLHLMVQLQSNSYSK